jgi:hypothetical protein
MFPFQDRFGFSSPARRRRRARRRGALPALERLEDRVVLSTPSHPPVIYKIETLFR